FRRITRAADVPLRERTSMYTARSNHPRPGRNLPTRSGLYDPADERDACGLASVVSLSGDASHRIISLALEALENLEHRGAVGSDAGTGDGAGILFEVPDAFLRGSLLE